MVTPPVAVGSRVFLSDHTTNEWSSDQRISNTRTISQGILRDPVKVLFLFQCFQEAQDNVLCEVLSKSFHSGEINIIGHILLPYQVVSLGFFLSKSHRKYSQLKLWKCHIGDHGMSILHQYLCGDEANKQEITEIHLMENDLTGASSHLIGDIISHLQPHTLWLDDNNITNVKDISTAVITTSTVKVLHMWGNDITAQEAVAISDMMISLEELNISNNILGDHGAELLSEGITNTKTLRVLNISNNNIGPSGAIAIANALTNITSLEELNMSYNKLGDHGAELLSEGITNTKTLRVLDISKNNIGPSGTTAIANALTNNTSLDKLNMSRNIVEQDGAKAIGKVITNNRKLKKLLLYDGEYDEGETYDDDDLIDKVSAMIIIRSLNNNNIITKLSLAIRICESDINFVTGEAEMVNSKRKSHNEHIIDFYFIFDDLQGELWLGKYTTENKFRR